MALHPMADTGNGLREVLLAGASGALWGVLLSVVVWLLRYREELAAGVAQEWGRKLAFAVFLNLVLSFAPGISIEAHLGGGFAGAAMAFWLDRRFRPNRAITGVGVALLVAAMLATLYASMWYSEVWEPLRVVHSVRRMLAEVMKTPDGP